MPARSTKTTSTCFTFNSRQVAEYHNQMDEAAFEETSQHIEADSQSKLIDCHTSYQQSAKAESPYIVSTLSLNDVKSDEHLDSQPWKSSTKLEVGACPAQSTTGKLPREAECKDSDAISPEPSILTMEKYDEGTSCIEQEIPQTTNSVLETPARRKATANMSPFFTRRNAPSCLVFPSLNAHSFGLIQERLAQNPFQLLVAIIFLHQTKGSAAVPILLQFLEVFPTARLLSETEPANIEPFIRSLGLQKKRSQLLVSLANAWLQDPPTRGRRYRYLHYPKYGSGSDIPLDDQPLTEDDKREAWEIAHLPGIGPYALDSWRIFCRDVLLERTGGSFPTPLASEKDISTESTQEWTRVLPADKELRVYLQWRWCRLGWLWDPISGNKTEASKDVLYSMEEGKLRSYLGFESPWLMNSGSLPREEQVLGGYHDLKSR